MWGCLAVQVGTRYRHLMEVETPVLYIIRVRGKVFVEGQKHKVIHYQIYLFYVQCVLKVAVHLGKALEVMSMSVYTVSKN
jgi:hypothetical protein